MTESHGAHDTLNVMLTFSAGGHFTEMRQVEEAFDGHDVEYATTRREDTKELDAHFLMDYGRNPLKFIINFLQAFILAVKTRPDVVVTTGAGLVVPFCYWCKLLGSRLVYIESFCRVEEPSLAGRIIYPIADLFLVQWESMLDVYEEKARYGGRVF